MLTSEQREERERVRVGIALRQRTPRGRARAAEDQPALRGDGAPSSMAGPGRKPRFPTAQEAVLRYRQAWERLFNPSSAHPAIPRYVCGREVCTGTSYTIVERKWIRDPRAYLGGRYTAGKLICGQCRQPWKPELRMAERGRGGGSREVRGDAHARDLTIYHLLLPLITHFDPRRFTSAEWRQHVVALFFYLDPRGGSYRAVARRGAEDDAHAPIPWTEARVEHMVVEVSAILEQRLARAGMLLRRTGEGR